MATHPDPPRWTVERYLEMERYSTVKHEFVDGQLYAMAGGARLHSAIGVNTVALLQRLVEGKPCQVYNSAMKLRLNPKVYVYPDAAVSCDERDSANEDESIEHPLLVVEVLSDTTAAYDRGGKFDLYRTTDALREYVLVDTHRIGIEVYRRDDSNAWVVRQYGPGEMVAFDSIAGAVAIEELYRGVRMPVP